MKVENKKKYHPLIQQVIDTIDKHKLLVKSTRKENVVLGLSGGPDSVFLLECLFQLQKRYNIQLTALHINHYLREEASEDAAFAKQLARERRILFVSYNYPVSWMAKTYKMTVEEAGRMARYESFKQEASKGVPRDNGPIIGKIATGHHKNDSQETMIFNLIRGTGLLGLTGIPIQRDNIIRPLLDCSKKDIIAYLEENKLPFRLDKTNELTTYSRNKIRHEIIPLFKEINPNTEKALEQLSVMIRMEYEYIEEMAQKAYNETVSMEREALLLDQKIGSYHPAIQSQVIKKMLEQLQMKEIRKTHIDDCMGLLSKQGGKQIRLPGLVAIKIQGGIWLSAPPIPMPPICYKLTKNNWIFIRDINIYIWYNSNHDKNKALEYQGDFQVTKTYLSTIYVPDDRELIIRGREIGDKVVTVGGSKSLSAFLIDEKIPFYKRDELLFIACKNDILFLLNNHSLNQKIRKNQMATKSYLEIWEGI